MTHVFSLEAIATCEQRGHAFAWVETWHGIGFDECSRCGVTGATRERSAGILPGATVDDPVSVAPPSREPAAAPAPRYADATAASPKVEKLDTAPRRPWAGSTGTRAERDAEIRRRLAEREPTEAIAAAFGMHESRVRQIAKAAAIPLRGRNQKRDSEIRQRVSSGESVASVAKAFGLCEERVYQIAPRGKCRNQAGASPAATE